MDLDAQNLMNADLQHRFVVIYETRSTSWTFGKKKTREILEEKTFPFILLLWIRIRNRNADLDPRTEMH